LKVGRKKGSYGHAFQTVQLSLDGEDRKVLLGVSPGFRKREQGESEGIAQALPPYP